MSISAFGVDHGGIAKSYVPGKGWTKAAEAGKTTLKAIQPGRYKKLRGVSSSDNKWKINRNAMHYDLGRDTRKTQMRDFPAARASWGFGRTSSGIAGYTVRTGSKSRGKSKVVLSSQNLKDRENADNTFLHEMAHARPNRSEYRVHHQIAMDPVKRMREEARADMAGGTYWRNKPNATDSGYVSGARAYDPTDAKPNVARQMFSGMNRQEAAGYMNVQDKIARGQRRKRKSL